jgi:hypothetical protein
MNEILLDEQNDDVIKQDKKSAWGYATSLTVTCLVTDFFMSLLNAKLEGKLTGRQDFWETTKEHLSGELIGDTLAIPVTEGLRYVMPDLTDKLGEYLGYVLQPVIEKAALAETEIWAKQNNISPFSEEFEQMKLNKCQQEKDNMASQATWLVVSPILNVAAQKLLFKKDETILAAASAILVNNVVTFAAHNLGRYNDPIGSNKIDNFIEEKIFTPLTNIFTGKNSEKLAHIEPLRDHYNSNNALIAY